MTGEKIMHVVMQMRNDAGNSLIAWRKSCIAKESASEKRRSREQTAR